MTRRLPIYLILDTSGSMAGEPIEATMAGMRSLMADLKTDPAALESVYLSIITFDSVAIQIVPLIAVNAFEVPMLEAHGCTALGAALMLLLECYEREVIKYSSTVEKGDYKPCVILLTDGTPTDDWEKIADEIGAKVRSNKVFSKFLAIGVGGNVDITALERLTDDVLMLHTLQPDDFNSFFNLGTQNNDDDWPDIPGVHARIHPKPPEFPPGGVKKQP